MNNPTSTVVFYLYKQEVLKANMTYKLTDEELAWLDTAMVQIDTEVAVTLSTPSPEVRAMQVGVTTHTCRTEALKLIRSEASKHNFLVDEVMGKCKLSQATREVEERRLKKLGTKRKEYKLKSRKHWKQKDKTRKEYNNRLWQKDPLSRIKYTFRAGCDITPEQWQSKVAPIWNRYGHKHLKISRVGSERLNVYNLILTYHPPRERYSREQPKSVRVYYGPDEAVYDSMSGVVKKD